MTVVDDGAGNEAPDASAVPASLGPRTLDDLAARFENAWIQFGRQNPLLLGGDGATRSSRPGSPAPDVN